MLLACLFSGGKDSAYALFNAVNQNHCIASLVSIKSYSTDSYMYHLPNIGLTEHAALALEMPLVVGEAKHGKEAELWVLYELLSELREKEGIEGVLTGAIASTYQKRRIDLICKKLRLQHIAPLWQLNQSELLLEMLQHNFSIMVVAVAAKGLGENWLGRMLDESAVNELAELQQRFSINPAGEGGEIETLVLDCPLFKKKISIAESKRHWDGVRGELLVKKARLVEKQS